MGLRVERKESKLGLEISKENDASGWIHLLDGELLVRPRLEIGVRIPLRRDDDEPCSPVGQAIVQLLSISSHEVVALLEERSRRSSARVNERTTTSATNLVPVESSERVRLMMEM